MSAGLASFYGTEARAVLKHRTKKLFTQCHAQLAVTIISISVQGSWAFDWGWHKLTLRPKKGGKPTTTRTRYLEIWQKGADGNWKIAIFLDNVDIPPQMPPKEVLAELRAGPEMPSRRPKGRTRSTPGISELGGSCHVSEVATWNVELLVPAASAEH